MKDRLLVIAIGLPGSGKSTFFEKMESLYYSYPDNVNLWGLASSDMALDALALKHKITYNEAFNRFMNVADDCFWAHLKRDIAFGHHTFVDRTNMSPKSRQRVLTSLATVDGIERYNIIYLDFQLDEDERVRRCAGRAGKEIPQKVIDSMRASYSIDHRELTSYKADYRVVMPTNFEEETKYIANLAREIEGKDN